MVAPPRDGAIRVAKNVWGLGQNLGAVRPSSIEPKPPRKQTSFDVRCPCSSVSFWLFAGLIMVCSHIHHNGRKKAATNNAFSLSMQ